MNIHNVSKNTVLFLKAIIDKIGADIPAIRFFKPAIVRIIDNKAYTIESILGLLADNNGEIDINGLLLEMENNVFNMSPFTIPTDILGDIILGGGHIKFELPVVNKQVSLNRDDINLLKEMMLTNN